MIRFTNLIDGVPLVNFSKVSVSKLKIFFFNISGIVFNFYNDFILGELMWVCIQVVMAANNPMGVDKEQVGAFILFHFPFFFFYVDYGTT